MNETRIIGKTIEGSYSTDDTQIFKFTDNSILKIKAVRFSGGDAELERSNKHTGLSDDQALKLGFLTPEDIEQKKRNKIAEQRGRQRQINWEQYQKLKEMFENEERVPMSKRV